MIIEKKIIIFFFNFYLFLKKFFNQKNIYSIKGVAICSIAKLENLYIKEFVEYYRKLGINKIYLYDNNDKKGENFNEILKEEVKLKFVKIINIRGKQKFQIPSYNHCYQKHLNDYSWFLFIDIDEYLYINNNCSLNDFLNNKKFENCDNIHINYKDLGDSDLLTYDNRTLIERFNKNFRYVISMKSFVRGGLKNAKMNIHRSYNVNKFCNSEGQIENPGDYFTKSFTNKSAIINHYITKSTEEFYKRLIKGWPHVKYFSLDYHNFINDRIKNYFNINKITKEKLNKLSILIKDKNLLNNLNEKLNNERKNLNKY